MTATAAAASVAAAAVLSSNEDRNATTIRPNSFSQCSGVFAALCDVRAGSKPRL